MAREAALRAACAASPLNGGNMSEPGPNCRSDHSPLTGTVAMGDGIHQDCENRVHVQNKARSSPENDFPFATRGTALRVIRAIMLTLPSEARPGEDSVTSGCDRACSLVIHDNDAIWGDFALRHLERRRNRAIDETTVFHCPIVETSYSACPGFRSCSRVR